jgi:hypothetical protein
MRWGGGGLMLLTQIFWAQEDRNNIGDGWGGYDCILAIFLDVIWHGYVDGLIDVILLRGDSVI